MRRTLTFIFLLFLLACALRPAGAYTFRYTDASGTVRVRWYSNIQVALSSSLADPPENVMAPGSEVQNAAVKALNHWRIVTNLPLFVQVSNPKTSVSQPDKGDGLSLITLAQTTENAKLFASDPTAVARTRIFTDAAGAIIEADIALNPKQLFSADGTPGTYDLEAVLTHEIGHLLGLDESAILGATMSPRLAPNGLHGLVGWAGRTLSEDDISGIRALYGLESKTRGTIAGRLRWPGGAPAFGINVWAEELSTGRVLASNVTLANGAYRLEGLKLGRTYRVLASTLSGPITAPDLADASGAYAGLLNTLTPVHAEELEGQLLLNSELTDLSRQLKSVSAAAPQPIRLGLDAKLADTSITLMAGQHYTLYLSGANLTEEKLKSLTVSSPYFHVPWDSVQIADAKIFVAWKEPVVKVALRVSPDAPPGDYTISLQTADASAFLAGALTVENAAFAKRSLPAAGDTLTAKTRRDNSATTPANSGAVLLLTEFAQGVTLREDKEK